MVKLDPSGNSFIFITIVKVPMKTKRKGRTVNADLGAYKDSCLDPLVFFAPPVLEPDSNDPGVQPRHLHQLLLAQEIAGQHGDVIVGNNVSNNTKCTNVTNPVNFDNHYNSE